MSICTIEQLTVHPSTTRPGMLPDVTIAFTAQGHAFNTFPKMGDTWLPPDLFEKQPFLSNFFENTATVQVSRPCTPLRLNACLAVILP
jgi:heme A synthase